MDGLNTIELDAFLVDMTRYASISFFLYVLVREGRQYHTKHKGARSSSWNIILLCFFHSNFVFL